MLLFPFTKGWRAVEQALSNFGFGLWANRSIVGRNEKAV